MGNANRVNATSYVRSLIDILSRAESIEAEVETQLDLSQYTAFYNLNPWNSEYYVASWGNGLKLMYLPAKSLKYALQYYKYIEGDSFQLVKNGKLANEKISFIRNKQRRIVKIKNGGNYHSRVSLSKQN